MTKIIDLTNQKHGQLTVLYRDKTKKERVFWVCLCDCGNKKSIAAKHLRSSDVTTCGCGLKWSGKKSRSWKGYQDISGKYWNQIKRNAGLRGFNFDIKIEEAWDVWIEQNGICKLSGVPIKLAVETKQTASIDRIDPKKGYSKDNIQWVHKDINIIKMDFTIEEFLTMCRKVTEYNKL